MTIKEELTDRTRKASDEIRSIKLAALRMEDREIVTFHDESGKQYSSWEPGRKITRSVGSVQVASINPAHDSWERYSELKRQVTLLLIQKAILKAVGDDPEKARNLTKSDVKDMIDAGLLRNHAKRPSRVAYGALRSLRKAVCPKQQMAVAS